MLFFFFPLQNKPLKPTSDTIIESKSFWFPKGNVWLKFLRIKREDPDGSKTEFMLQWWTGKRKRKNLGGMNIGWRSPRLEDYRGLLTFVGVRGGQGISYTPQGGDVRGKGVRIEVLPNPILYQQKGKKNGSHSKTRKVAHVTCSLPILFITVCWVLFIKSPVHTDCISFRKACLPGPQKFAEPFQIDPCRHFSLQC